jgi:hypothetical protein
MVQFDELYVTTRAVAGSRGRMAVAMAAVPANQFGWYQIHGSAQGQANGAVADNAVVYLTAGAGAVDDAVVATDMVIGARFRSSTGGAGAVTIELNYPSAPGLG